MLSAKSPAFYTGSFIPTYTPSNAPSHTVAELTQAVEKFCSAEHFDALQCATAAQGYGERVGVPVVMVTPTASTPSKPLPGLSTPILAAAMYALSTLPTK